MAGGQPQESPPRSETQDNRAQEASLAGSEARRLYREGKLLEAAPFARRFEELTRGQSGDLGFLHEIAAANIETIASAMMNKGAELISAENYVEATPLIEAAVKLIREQRSPGDETRKAAEDVLQKAYHRAETAYLAFAKQATELSAARKYEEAGSAAQHAADFGRVLANRAPNLYGDALIAQAGIYLAQYRYRDALPPYKEAVELFESYFPPNADPARAFLAKLHDQLAEIYFALDSAADAEQHYKRALDLRQGAIAPDRYQIGYSLNRLGLLYLSQQPPRTREAEDLFNRALEITQSLGASREADSADVLNNLGLTYDAQGRSREAEALYLRALAIDEKVYGQNHPEVATILINMGLSNTLRSRLTEAEANLTRALSIEEAAFGRDSLAATYVMHNLGGVWRKKGHLQKAAAMLERSRSIREKILGEGNSNVAADLGLLGDIARRQADWAAAYRYFTKASEILTANAAREAASLRPAANLWEQSQLNEAWGSILGRISAGHRLVKEEPRRADQIRNETFEAAQWALGSEAARSLALMAARSAKGDPALAALVRERQDLVAEWQTRDSLRNAQLGQAPKQRDPKAVEENLSRLGAIGARIDAIDGTFREKFPDYAALASPAPLSVEDAQTLLGADEALVLFLNTKGGEQLPEETFIWAVTKTDMRWARSGLGTAALAREVQALRCGLDATAWDEPRCLELTGRGFTVADRNAGKPLPFDHARAHKLYRALFGQVDGLIQGKQLLIVPSGPLTQLPFQVLVTAPARSGDDKPVPWLIRKHALSVLPAVSSLKALRRVARPGAATKPLIGFGNPLLDGNPDDPVYGADDKERAKLAREKQQCTDAAAKTVASNRGFGRGVKPIDTRSGLANAGQIRMAPPLPETADELCAVARGLKADPASIYLGWRATERNVKELSASGQLAQYRIVHFATHGALAGQVSGNNEPGLLLTPPNSPSEEDDGYLTATEIAALKLDADWAILSACNTAAGGAQGAEALSGLARAFIYAQARALLVSHWEVNSDATVKLITGAVSRLTADKTIGRAEAMRLSMLALIDHGEPGEAHPANWAPFAVVGEGGAGR